MSIAAPDTIQDEFFITPEQAQAVIAKLDELLYGQPERAAIVRARGIVADGLLDGSVDFDIPGDTKHNNVILGVYLTIALAMALPGRQINYYGDVDTGALVAHHIVDNMQRNGYPRAFFVWNAYSGYSIHICGSALDAAVAHVNVETANEDYPEYPGLLIGSSDIAIFHDGADFPLDASKTITHDLSGRYSSTGGRSAKYVFFLGNNLPFPASVPVARVQADLDNLALR